MPAPDSLRHTPPGGSSGADAVLDALDPEQRAVATALSGPVCVLAGAGTGKTRAITHRIAYAVLSGHTTPQRVLAVTFTTRAAGEMRGRLARLGVPGVQARTFHAAALRQLRYFWPRTVGGEPPQLLASKAPLVGEAARGCGLSAEPSLVRDLAAEIEWAKASQVAPDDYVAAATRSRRRVPGTPADVARVYADYERRKRDVGRIDFEDVLLLTVGMLHEHAEVASAVREQYRHFVVDEYQDANALQQRLLDLWLGDRDAVCVVGDPNQTIYSFAGADPGLLRGFQKRFPQATVVEMVRNYRSTPQVLRLANSVGGAALSGAGSPGVRLVAQQGDGPAPELLSHRDDDAEAAHVARSIRRLLSGGLRASEIAVLFRINAQSEIYEQALADAGIPYVLRGAERFFERPEVREAMLLLRGAARAEPDGEVPSQVRAVLAAVGWAQEPPPGTGARRERWESLQALVRLADEVAAAHPGSGLDRLVTELDERAAAQHAPAAEGVTLASLHAAKGLEWEAVFLVGLVDGLVPIRYAESPEQLDEERRLLYVGVTRARRHLTLSWSSFSSGRATHPSPFLDGLRPPDAAGSAPAEGRAQRRSRRAAGVARCRVCERPLGTAVERKLGRCEGCPSSLDELLYARLRDWRLDRAREAGLPAFCVFTDATLTAIAERRPGTVSELAAVPGVGAVKLDRYAGDVLALCTGGEGSPAEGDASR